MASGFKQVETLFTPQPERLAAVRTLIVESLVRRGSPPEDAGVVVEDVLVQIDRDPSIFANKLVALDENESWFAAIALKAYAARMRDERRQRWAQMYQWLCALAAGEIDPDADADAVLNVAHAAGVTQLQRTYLERAMLDLLSIGNLAQQHHSTPSAVRGVLQRAGRRMRQHHLRQYRWLAGGQPTRHATAHDITSQNCST